MQQLPDTQLELRAQLQDVVPRQPAFDELRQRAEALGCQRVPAITPTIQSVRRSSSLYSHHVGAP